MDDLELKQLELKQELLKEELGSSPPEVATEQKPETFEKNLLSWIEGGGVSPPPYYDESEVEGQVSSETFATFKKFMDAQTSDKKSSIAQKISKGGMELAEAGQSGVVDVPDVVDVYKEGGTQLNIPPAAQKVLEGIANTAITGLGYAEAGIGYTVGSVADLLVKAGVSESMAYRMAKDFMAMPEAFAGSPSQLFRPNMPSGLKTTTKTTAKATEAPQMNEQEIAKLIRESVGTGKSADKAIEKLIAQAKINPEIKEMAERLGFKLPFDIFAEGEIVKRSAGITRDIKGSAAEVVFRQEVQDAIIQADNVIKELGATNLSTISDKIGNALETTQTSLKVREKDLFDRINGNEEKNIVGIVQKTEKVDITNTLDEINRLIKEEGIESLDPKIIKILKRKDLTYGGLLRLKESIGDAAFKNKGPYSDASTGQLKLLYGKLSDDQFANAIRIGGDEVEDLIKTANSITVKRKELEQTLVKILGKDLQGSIAPGLKTAITSGAKGDISNTNRIISIIPEELRKDAILSAIQDATRAKDLQGNVNFGLAQFSTLYQNLKRQEVVFKAISKELGPETTKVLDELAEISKRITEARANVAVTGKANQALLTSIQAENVLEKFLTGSTTARVMGGLTGTATSLAIPIPGIGGLLATAFASIKFTPKDRLKLLGDLFNNIKFRKMVDEVAQTGSASDETLSSVAKLPLYKRWAKTMGIDDSRNWLQGAIVTTAETPPTDANEALDNIVEEQSSLDQSSAAQDIISTISAPTINKIRQFA
jgi:hypothetical protein